MSLNERIKKVVKWLIGNGFAQNQEEIGFILGYSTKSSFSQVLNGHVPIPSNFIDKLCALDCSINREWINSEIGSMTITPPLDKATEKEGEPRKTEFILSDPDFKGVPYYDIDITGGIVESFNDVKEKPDFFVDFKPFNDCAAYMPIFGDSMFPMFASGEILAVKQMHNYDAILWGEPYLVVTNAEWDNLRTVKLVHPHDEQDKIILRASNPNFKGDTVVPKTAIVGLFIVKGKINRRQL